MDQTIRLGQVYHIAIFHNRIQLGSAYRLKLLPPTNSITNNINTYSSSSLPIVNVPPGSSPYTPSKGGRIYTFTDSETIHLPTVAIIVFGRRARDSSYS